MRRTTRPRHAARPSARRAVPRTLPAALAATAAAVAASLVTAAVLPTGAAPAPTTVDLGGLAGGVESVAYSRAVTAAAEGTPTVTLVATGGTIAGLATGRDTLTDYRAGQITGAQMVEHLEPELSAVADVEVVQFGNAGSSGYTVEQFRELTLVVEEALETSDGVVVTTGTDTQEEFAYWLDLTVQSTKPVVTTGAMRPSASAQDGELVFGADGPANLYNAVRLAASATTTCFGTVLLSNDEVFAARDVTKTSSYRLDTFQAREYGVLGWIDGPEITMGRATPRVAACDEPERWATPFDLSTVGPEDLARTEVVTSYQQAGGEAITAFAAAGVDGIVTAGTGAGGISRAQSQARSAAAAEGVVFVSTTRTGSGSVHGGSGQVVAGGDLLPQTARLLLLLGLTFAPGDAEQVREWFGTVGSPSFATTAG